MHILHENQYLIAVSSAVNGFENCFFFRSSKTQNFIAKLQGETGLTCSVQALKLKCDV